MAVDAGLNHTCAIGGDGTIVCWYPRLPPEGVQYLSDG